jgi:hypothetical protein
MKHGQKNIKLLSKSVTKTCSLMSYRAKVTVCSKIRSKHTKSLCGQNVEILNVETEGAQRKYKALEG